MPPRIDGGYNLARRFRSLLLLFVALSTLSNGDADFESVRIRHDLTDMSGRGGDPVEKYWRQFAIKHAAVVNLC